MSVICPIRRSICGAEEEAIRRGAPNPASAAFGVAVTRLLAVPRLVRDCQLGGGWVVCCVLARQTIIRERQDKWRTGQLSIIQTWQLMCP